MSVTKLLLDESHVLLRKQCERFARAEIAPHATKWEEAGIFPRELYGKAAAAGLLGIGFDESVGGSGGGSLHLVVSIEGLMRGGSTGVAVGLWSLGIGLPPLVQSKDSFLTDTFVRPTLAGETIACLAITEPGTGSDVAGVRTRAVRDDATGDYIVNGAKLFITSGTRADVITTLCRTGDDPHGGLTFFVLTPDMNGVSVSRSLRKTGWCASDTAELAFDNVRVPATHRVGAEGSGFVTLMRNFQTERLALAAYGVATAELALEESLRYVRERSAFGRPIAKFQVTKHKLADMATKVEAAKCMTYQVAAAMDAGKYQGRDKALASAAASDAPSPAASVHSLRSSELNDARIDGVRPPQPATAPRSPRATPTPNLGLVKEVSMAKNFAAEVAVSVCYDAVQLHGGMGYMRETLVERLSRDARLLPIGGGTQEVMKEIIAKQLGL